MKIQSPRGIAGRYDPFGGNSCEAEQARASGGGMWAKPKRFCPVCVADVDLAGGAGVGTQFRCVKHKPTKVPTCV